ncbi:MAG: enoyl-CoA hydratase/isomerase family protein, partial [Candidatus Dormibacteraeota bacterium]|nr:enoyl-CoA hydratase/isomerase family protein [Candidatus Dormibacteraeota bacterium]
MIDLAWRDRVALLTMRHGKVNALDVELCQALVGAVDSAVDGGAQAVVVTGSDGAFSAGVDLRRLMAGGETYVAGLLPALQGVFVRLARLELPVVAAVNGHAIAGGFVLLAAADRALMAEGPGRVGVTELLVGVPISSMGMALVGRRAGEVLWRKLVLEGSTFTADQAV